MDAVRRNIGALAMAGSVCFGPIGCNEHPLKSVELKRAVVGGGTVALTPNKDVDILFVIDNSGSMGEEQATLAANFEQFIEQLQAPGIEANYRIAVTTTDAGHVHCQGGQDGRFQISSCRGRTQDFQRPGTTAPEDNFFEESCASVCTLDSIQTLPTATLVDQTEKSRPWIESVGGVTNLPEGVSPTQAFQCVGPQGVSGCGYEAPLEAMRRAFVHSRDENAGEYGFVRPGAILAVVFVTDEADCSARWRELPEPWLDTGLQTFWSEENKGSGYPQSEVCWFAGVSCTDNPDGTKDCEPANKDAAGFEADGEDAVLFPLGRYVDFLQDIEDSKREIDAAANLQSSDVLVALIGGVPPDYARGQEIPYRDGLVDQDIEFQRDNGIAPGCRTLGIGEAVPPVRLREFAAAFEAKAENPNNLFSVCQSDYTPALQRIVDLIRTQVRQACVPVCVEDIDPTTATIEHNCIVTEVTIGSGSEVRTVVPPCQVEGERATVPEGIQACYVSLSDKTGETPVLIDDLDKECIQGGWNLQLKIERPEGVREQPGSSVVVQCSNSQNVRRDCPDL